MTHCVDVFLAACQAIRARIEMVPKSRGDKEYFAQEWFTERLQAIGLPYRSQGRNSYPDFWVGDDGRSPIEGYEVKSLAFAKGRPARETYDANSTVPSGRRQGRDVFLVFILYEGTASSLRTVHSLSIAHADLVNSDHEIAEMHVNTPIHAFGSYGDGLIRDRKMYVFPHPFRLDPEGIGRRRLIVPAEWAIRHPRLKSVGSIRRSPAHSQVLGYSIDLRRQRKPHVEMEPNPEAGRERIFEVFEAVTL